MPQWIFPKEIEKFYSKVKAALSHDTVFVYKWYKYYAFCYDHNVLQGNESHHCF